MRFQLRENCEHWFGVLIPSSDLTDLKAYGGYSLIIVVGLLLESVRNDPASVPFTVRRPSLIRQLPFALRQTAIAIGFLFLIMVLGKDRHLSRLFLLVQVQDIGNTIGSRHR
jgi:hypothetical protein